MIWTAQWGPHLERLQALRDSGQRVPALENRPDIEAGDDFCLAALTVLAGDRDAAGHVSFLSALRFGEAYGLTLDETLELHQVLAIAHACLSDWRKAKPVG